MASFSGTAGPDQLSGTISSDTISGMGGNDVLDGRGGNDVLDGGGGNDTLRGGNGSDSLSGGDDADTLIGGRGADLLSGGSGNDVFEYASGDGRDTITDFAAGDILRLSGYSAAQSVAQVGTSVVITLSLIDKITVSNSTLATVKAALQFGGSTSGGGTGGTVSGSSITGTSGNDTLNGTAGNNSIYGLAGNDLINGGGGDDRIYGGTGEDTLTGGAGSDTFVYSSLADLSKVYHAEFITDWTREDRIDLSAIDANALLAGNQAFQFAGYSFGHPPTVTTTGTLTIGGFGGELWVLGYTDSVAGPDLMINLWSSAGESALTVYNFFL